MPGPAPSKTIEPLAGFAFSADSARKMGEYAQHPVRFAVQHARPRAP